MILAAAQVVLDPASAASQGARGVYDNIEHNTAHRNIGYAELGHDPADPGSEPTAPPAEATPTEPPVTVDIPHLSQSGAVLHCTMGNWEGEPTSYAYAWTVGGVAAGPDAATYDVQPADVGQNATCTVTASNAAGSTAAPVSNSVLIA